MHDYEKGNICDVCIFLIRLIIKLILVHYKPF